MNTEFCFLGYSLGLASLSFSLPAINLAVPSQAARFEKAQNEHIVCDTHG